MSVDPAGGSTVSRPAATKAAARSVLAEGRAPRRTAASPAAVPAPPRMAAAHRLTSTGSSVRCRGNHHGGPNAGAGMVTTAPLGPASEITMKITVAAPMPVTAAQPRSRGLDRRTVPTNATLPHLAGEGNRIVLQ